MADLYTFQPDNRRCQPPKKPQARPKLGPTGKQPAAPARKVVALVPQPTPHGSGKVIVLVKPLKTGFHELGHYKGFLAVPVPQDLTKLEEVLARYKLLGLERFDWDKTTGANRYHEWDFAHPDASFDAVIGLLAREDRIDILRNRRLYQSITDPLTTKAPRTW